MKEETKQHSGIAIVGLAGRFPKAQNISEFWKNLCGGTEGISFFDKNKSAAPGNGQNSNLVKARGLLDGADLFDAPFFGIKPTEAQVMDPQHRVLLECAWAALEDAGYDPARFDGAIGVFAGMSMNTYFAHNLLSNPELIARVGDYQTMLGNDKDFLPTRVSYKLGLTGPSLNIQTACSTSLVAVCVACQHLLNFQCDMALAGAVSVRFPQTEGYHFQEGGIASPDGHCRVFDAQAAGLCREKAWAWLF
jgi:acyl transferase domain-containing protein